MSKYAGENSQSILLRYLLSQLSSGGPARSCRPGGRAGSEWAARSPRRIQLHRAAYIEALDRNGGTRMIFEWDRRKAASNRAKHGISFEEATTVFGDPLGRIADDPRHSEAEQRHVLLGHSRAERLVTVMFTERGDAISIISARPATRQERRDYGKGKS